MVDGLKTKLTTVPSTTLLEGVIVQKNAGGSKKDTDYHFLTNFMQDDYVIVRLIYDNMQQLYCILYKLGSPFI